MRKMPYRKFHPRRQYQSLPDFKDDDSDEHDDVTSFSSVRLAKDQDKPTKWKSRRNTDTSRTNCKLFPEPTTGSISAPSCMQIGSQGSSNSSKLEHSRSEPKPRLTGLSETPSFKTSIFIEQREPSSNIDMSVLSRRKENKSKADHVLSRFENSSPVLGQNETATTRLPDTLPSPKENRHPQVKIFSMCTAPPISSSSGEEDGTTDARAALAPSSALNLIQCWRNAGFNQNDRELMDARNMQAKNRNNKDPLLVALQVVRLKRELKKLRVDADAKRSQTDSSVSVSIEEPPLHSKKTVRFADQLVTEVRERPFTEPDEMDKLYFVSGELEELEWDRCNVELDQFECIIQDESSATHQPYIEVEHNSRKLHAIGEEGLPHSLSDLSFY